ncbi:hypothetical protein ANACOL_01974 [Anaerotruncus colihominis DSM 17241]|uniref:Uncharacterized protein n=1 Tax=Anaerotruncus colihominis DSM 17241 TaxID=445972 RepID=B0PB23_9FIRM|nr:hypothetical protein ANACOL_01974 [Anaerotruncus colihominis DSM 17241]
MKIGIPSFSASSSECHVKKPRNLKGFLYFLPCIHPQFANNPVIFSVSNKP